eukprot:4806891-Pyramimonas_sp.AAC.1
MCIRDSCCGGGTCCKQLGVDALWDRLGPSLAMPGLSWDVLKLSWAAWSHSGSPLGASWGSLGAPCGPSGRSESGCGST